jgi:mRNA interferase MazF
MLRGEVYWARFPQGIGGEIRNDRPAVIVTNNAALASALNRVQVVPLTSNTERVFRGEAVVEFLAGRSKALATQLGTIDRSRLGRRMGALSPADMRRVDEAIKEQLGLGQGSR